MYSLAVLLVFCTAVSTVANKPPIVYKRVSAFDFIYDDRGTGSYHGITVWRPRIVENGYYRLGDVAVPYRSEPMTSAVVVKPLTEDALAPPDSFTEVWNDRGSGGPLAVRFFTMNPRSGYTCLGSVALDNYQTPSPDKNLYRCVKSDYVSRGQGYYSLIWNDRGSGCPKAVIIYGNIPSGNSGYDIESNTFTAIGNYNTPTGSPPMLNGQVVKNHQEVLGLASLEDLAFVVYQTPDMEFVWSDRMTGCYLGIAVYRSKGHSGTYSLGDVAARSTNGKPEVGYVVKPLKDDALIAPEDYREIWNDKGTGGKFDVTFYQPICPTGYVALGDVAVASYTEDPPVDAIRCVKLDYVTNGQWDFVWNDRGSGSPDSLTVWEARSTAGSNGQGLAAITTSASYSDMPNPPKVLKAELVNFVTGKPVSSYTIQDVRYHFDDTNIVANEPESLARTTVVNELSSEKEASRTIEYSYEEVKTWESAAGLEVSVETTFSTGVPFEAGGKVSVSSTASYEYEWGGEVRETTTDSIEVVITVQGKSSKIAEIVGNRYTINVPYTATLITNYVDGTSGKRYDLEGVFHGVQVNDVRVIFHEDVPLL